MVPLWKVNGWFFVHGHDSFRLLIYHWCFYHSPDDGGGGWGRGSLSTEWFWKIALSAEFWQGNGSERWAPNFFDFSGQNIMKHTFLKLSYPYILRVSSRILISYTLKVIYLYPHILGVWDRHILRSRGQPWTSKLTGRKTYPISVHLGGRDVKYQIQNVCKGRVKVRMGSG